MRFANTSELEEYLASAQEALLLPVLGIGSEVDRVGREQQFEEALFLGLRVNAGVSLADLRAEFGRALVDSVGESLEDAIEAGLMERDEDRVRLTARGRMASNEVFSRLLVVAA
jgi:oxygen-independent coproporphyrinogen-3 oxidase